MEYWSWILTSVGVTGFMLARKKIWWCWYINIACQALWLTYAIVTEQWGFIAASVIYTVVFTMNAITWTKEHRIEQGFKNYARYGSSKKRKQGLSTATEYEIREKLRPKEKS